MSGMCDQEAPFKEAFNVREVCMLSCGVCNRYMGQLSSALFKYERKWSSLEICTQEHLCPIILIDCIMLLIGFNSGHPHSGSVSGSNWNLESVGFCGEGKTGVPGEKPLGAEKTTNNKLNPHMTPRPWNRTRATLYWCRWEASAITTAPPLLLD